MSPLNIGIEACGKSVTVIAVADDDGNVLAAESHPLRLNYHEGMKAGLGGALYHLVKNILQSCGLEVEEFSRDGGRICAGITGVTTKYDRKIGMRDVWQAAGLTNATLISTGGIEIEFTGATRSLRGAAVSCHTGSAAMARTEHAIRRVGGWGPLIGDEGSGYWIGSRAIRVLCRLRDERDSQPTLLEKAVWDELKTVPIWNEIIERHSALTNNHWVDAFISLVQRTRDSKEYRYIISDLSKAVFKVLEENPHDTCARNIVSEAADVLIEQAQTAIKRAQLPFSEIPLVLRGGVIKYNAIFSDLLRLRIGERWPEIRIILPSDAEMMRPAVGALMFALSGSMLSLPPREVIERVEHSASQFPALANS
jgi:N-acetylglucosamine kinase-like BadF-type ATPase